jgi:hypothetical protein
MNSRDVQRYGVIGVAGILLATGVVHARGAETIKSEKPIDFYYVAGQEALVPFGNVQSCKVAYVGSHAGLVIERVVADGQDVKPLSIKGGVLDGRWDLMLEKPGESFRYQLKLSALESGTLGTPFDGKSFPLTGDSPPKLVEIYYRIRCADGKLSQDYVTRGVRFDGETATPSTGAGRAGRRSIFRKSKSREERLTEQDCRHPDEIQTWSDEKFVGQRAEGKPTRARIATSRCRPNLARRVICGPARRRKAHQGRTCDIPMPSKPGPTRNSWTSALKKSSPGQDLRHRDAVQTWPNEKFVGQRAEEKPTRAGLATSRCRPNLAKRGIRGPAR